MFPLQTALCRHLLSAAGLAFLGGCCQARDAAPFRAYYTHRNSGEAFEAVSRTGPYADVVVRLDDSRELVFWRASSYRPQFRTADVAEYVPELVPRAGDGTGIMPDRTNMVSEARIVEAGPERVVVHWRYLRQFSVDPVANPGGTPGGRFTGSNHEAVVDEYFAITPAGHVTRTVRAATSHAEDWQDPLQVTTQEFDLAVGGIRNMTTSGPGVSPSPAPVAGNPTRGPNVVTPRAWWKFDEGTGRATHDPVTSTTCTVSGNGARWVPGISGTALVCDGLDTSVVLPAASAPVVTGDITLEGWLCLDAYPFADAPLLRRDGDGGFFLGVSGHGYPLFRLTRGATTYEVTVAESQESDKPTIKQRGMYAGNLDLHRWYHLAGVYAGADGTMRLYVDGVEVAHLAIPSAAARSLPASTDIILCRGADAPTIDWLGDAKPGRVALDGLADEIRLYDVALSAGQVGASRANFAPSPAIIGAAAARRRQYNVPTQPAGFGARYARLEFYEGYDDLWRLGDDADVVVGFEDSPAKLVFWHANLFVPTLVNERGEWAANGFNETWGTSGGWGSQEPISDRQLLLGSVHIVENTPARVIVQWRYPLVDYLYAFANYDPATGWGDWADWYYTIYPDGTIYRSDRLWTSTAATPHYEWQETEMITGPGQHPEDVVLPAGAITLVDPEGNATTRDWHVSDPNPPVISDEKVQILNFTGDWDPYTIADLDATGWYSGPVNAYSDIPCWNHWPAFHLPAAGRATVAPDRPSSTLFSWLFWPVEETGPNYLGKVHLWGMTDAIRRGDTASLATRYRSWAAPPVVQDLAGLSSQGYDRHDGAYHLAATTAGGMSFRLEASPDSPLQNPAFVISNWSLGEPSASMKTTGASLRELRRGLAYDTDGSPTLVLWTRLAATQPVTFEIAPGVNLPGGWQLE